MAARGKVAKAFRGRRVTVATSGFDPDLQGVGGGPASPPLLPYSLGLRIPIAPPTTATNRYLYLLGFYSLQAKQRARIVGWRQYLSIGAYTQSGSGCKYPVELEVTSPAWRFTDGNVAWAIRRMPAGRANQIQTAHHDNKEGQQFQYGTFPSLLFESAIGTLKGYVPPNGGAFWGDPIPGLEPLGLFRDLRAPWRTTMPAGTLDTEVEGPCDLLFQASVLQTRGGCAIVLPVGLPADVIPREDAFVAAFRESAQPAVFWRIAGALDLEIEGRKPLEAPERLDPCAPKGL